MAEDPSPWWNLTQSDTVYFEVSDKVCIYTVAIASWSVSGSEIAGAVIMVEEFRLHSLP